MLLNRLTIILLISLGSLVPSLGANIPFNVPPNFHVHTDDVRVTSAPSIQTEVSLAVNPLNPNNIIIGYNDYSSGDWRAHYSYSVNGGSSWTRGVMPLPPTNLPTPAKDDSALAFDGTGRAYYVALANGLGQIVLFTSNPDGSGNAGASWSNGIVVNPMSASGVDKPAIAIDTTGGPHNGNIYIAWVDFAPGIDSSTLSIMLRTGKIVAGTPTFPNPPVVASSIHDIDAWGPSLAIAADGTVYIAYIGMDSGYIWFAKRIEISRSDDGGSTFALSGQSVSSITPPTWNTGCKANGLLLAWIVSGTNCSGRATSIPSMVIASNGTVILAWTDMRYTDADILASHSSDKGATWSAPVQVNRDKIPGATNGKDQFLPAAAMAGGRLWVFFYDRSSDDNNVLMLLSGASSTNMGASFSPIHEISDQFIDPEICSPNWYGNCPFGDYIGAAAVDNGVNQTFYVAWSGNSPYGAAGSNEVDVFFEKFNSTTPFPPNALAVVSGLGIPLWNNYPNTPETICVKFPRYCLPLPLQPCLLDPSSCRAILTAEVLPVDGFTGTVNLYASNMSTGVTVQITPSSAVPPFNATVTIDASNAALISCVNPCEDDIGLVFNSTAGQQVETISLLLPNAPILGIYSNTYNASETLPIIGKGFTANSTISIMLDGVTLAGTTADHDGSFKLTSAIPSAIPNGKHTLRAIDNHGNSANAAFLTPKLEAEPAEGEVRARSPTPSLPLASSGLLALGVLSLLLAATSKSMIKRRRLTQAHC